MNYSSNGSHKPKTSSCKLQFIGERSEHEDAKALHFLLQLTSQMYSHDVSESEIVKAILEYLHWKGFYCWRQNQGAIPLPNGGFRRFVGLRGVADILCVLPGGRFLAIEVKRPGGKPSPDQRQFLEKVNELGGVGIWCSSVEELENDLKSIGVV